MSMPERIQLRRKRGWRKPENTVSVARPTRFGNPFRVIGESGSGGTVTAASWGDVMDTWGPGKNHDATVGYVSCSRYVDAVGTAVSNFRMLCEIRQRDEPERFAKFIAPLVGKNLACWCSLDSACHADVLLELANGGSDNG
ncbi:DUF4326 domain-containing protein [Paramicrobacterium chengjingii]|uniref:DUF4326 domain-containing protein n=1 Tax=Paramicrobacterium chengjingii TaxID=2769067 RepID=UPI001AB05546|nr:DUF4326 domain-containing protein [Microbacterium chengjingii]